MTNHSLSDLRVGTRVKLKSVAEPGQRLSAAAIARAEEQADQRVWDVVAETKQFAVLVDSGWTYTVVVKASGVRGWVPPRDLNRPRRETVQEQCRRIAERLERGETTVCGATPATVLWTSRNGVAS